MNILDSLFLSSTLCFLSSGSRVWTSLPFPCFWLAWPAPSTASSCAVCSECQLVVPLRLSRKGPGSAERPASSDCRRQVPPGTASPFRYWRCAGAAGTATRSGCRSTTAEVECSLRWPSCARTDCSPVTVSDYGNAGVNESRRGKTPWIRSWRRRRAASRLISASSWHPAAMLQAESSIVANATIYCTLSLSFPKNIASNLISTPTIITSLWDGILFAYYSHIGLNSCHHS